MFAIVCAEHGPEMREVPVPVCQPNEVLVRVYRCALNRVDLAMAQGMTHGTSGGLNAILGLEWAGVVEQVGSAVPRAIQIGQPVMGSGKQAFAEYVVADWGRVLPIPGGLTDFTDAVVLPIALQTMHDAMVTHGEIHSEKTVLIHGIGSGVGLMALQIAKCYGNETIVGTSRNDKKINAVKKLGLRFGINTNESDWVTKIAESTNNRGIDLVIDMLSGPDTNKILSCMALEGKIINVGRLAGKVSDFDFNLHALRRIAYIGVTFRTRTKEDVRIITKKMMHDFSGFISAGKLKLPVDSVYSFDSFNAGLMRMQKNDHFGKIVLSVRDV